MMAATRAWCRIVNQAEDPFHRGVRESSRSSSVNHAQIHRQNIANLVRGYHRIGKGSASTASCWLPAKTSSDFRRESRGPAASELFNVHRSDQTMNSSILAKAIACPCFLQSKIVRRRSSFSVAVLEEAHATIWRFKLRSRLPGPPGDQKRSKALHLVRT